MCFGEGTSSVEEAAASIISECSAGEGGRFVLVYQTVCCHMLQECDRMRKFVYNSWHLENLLIIMPHSDVIPYILESNRHPFYSIRGPKNQVRIRFAVVSWILEKW